MNAKKIMGAVLVALLAAALFVGAGAAANSIGTVFLYQDDAEFGGATIPAGVYTTSNGKASIEITTAKAVLPLNVENFENGAKYYLGNDYITVFLPNAGITAVGNPGITGAEYDAMANGLIASQNLSITATPTVAGATVEALIIYDADGNVYERIPGTGPYTILAPYFSKGTYEIQAVLLKDSFFVNTVEGAQLYGEKYPLTVYAAKPTLTVSADSVIMGNVISVTITGEPGEDFYLDAEDFIIPATKQLVATGAGTAINLTAVGEAIVTLPNSGKLTVFLEAANDDGKKDIILYAYDAGVKGAKDASVKVEIVKGKITANATADSFFIGNPIYLEGTTTAGSDLSFYIEGTNFPFVQIDLVADIAADADLDVENGKWTVGFDSTQINSGAKKLIAGTYTIVVSTWDAVNDPYPLGITSMKEAAMDAVYGTAAVTLTQPFLTGIEAAPVAIQGSDYVITGTAYSADVVNLYVFGTNYFKAFNATTDEEVFEFDQLKGTVTNNMAPGTYFYLIQHPMNDKKFNVWSGEGNSWTIDTVPGAADADFYYEATGATVAATPTFIFNAWQRGTNYAAQALLDEISGQNIDDIFVQGTFEVEAQKLTINPIPAEVTKGSKLAVSGTTNSGKGVEVIVNVLAGTFGATVKGDENAATFITEKAVTQEDGTWEAAIDTSKLVEGNYIVTVELNGQMYDSAAVKIVAAADQPDTPVDPEQPGQDEPGQDEPVAPETPGFGALAALAGLGAVAVLLLRRE